MTKTLIITGGAGFIGSNFVQTIHELRPDWRIVNLDALTYAGNLENLTEIEGTDGYTFVHGDITKPDDVRRAFDAAEAFGGPISVVHFAAGSHVDRSIISGLPFVEANVAGTQVMLDVCRERELERFLHVSTDEVYGSLGATGYFTEETPLQPNSPYAASKTASDLFVRAAIHTHGFPAVITRCSNNYGPYQFPEKLIPLMILNGLEGKPLPVYGTGENVRDWLYVEDHARALWTVVMQGRVGDKRRAQPQGDMARIVHQCLAHAIHDRHGEHQHGEHEHPVDVARVGLDPGRVKAPAHGARDEERRPDHRGEAGHELADGNVDLQPQ